ncbi:MAG: AAA family ATPase, partial [Acidobacteria bacterium]|nr:AAA family ATPase [Acidobacteriota bacterium]
MKWTLPLALSLVDEAHKNGEGWKAICPAHPDVNPSLSLRHGDKQELILKCHAGCDYEAVLAELTQRLYEQRQEYIYKDRTGSTIGKVVRTYDDGGNKKFFQNAYINGEWLNKSSSELKTTPYRLPQTLRAIDNSRPIFIVEGEKDADTLHSCGRTATCNAGGGGKWSIKHSEYLIDARKIYIIADNDAAGYDHAWKVYNSLEEVGTEAEIKVLISPYAKDISEHLALGYSLKELKILKREDAENEPLRFPRVISLASFVFDSPPEVPAIWGHNGKTVLWADGQGLVIVAPQGAGKTTLGILLLESLISESSTVLGFPIRPSKRGVLYMAMDRSIQIATAMRRRFGKYGREALAERGGYVWNGPAEEDFSRQPGLLLEIAEYFKVDTLFIDSLKDAVLRPTNEESAQSWNRAVQLCTAEGIQVCVLNHIVKRAGHGEPINIDDSYGSNWLTAGMGSVLALNGGPYSSFLELTHLKPPANLLESLIVQRNNKTGALTVIGDSSDWTWFFTEPHTTA